MRSKKITLKNLNNQKTLKHINMKFTVDTENSTITL